MHIIAVRFVKEPDVALVARSAPEVLGAFRPAIQNGFVLTLIVGTSQGENVLGPDHIGGPMTAGSGEGSVQSMQLTRRHAEVERPRTRRQHGRAGGTQKQLKLLSQIVIG